MFFPINNRSHLFISTKNLKYYARWSAWVVAELTNISFYLDCQLGHSGSSWERLESLPFFFLKCFAVKGVNQASQLLDTAKK